MFHPDIITELNKVMTFSKTNKKKKRKALFDLFVDWLQTTNTRYNRAHKNFFILGIGHMSADDTKKMFLEYYDTLFEKNVTVAKFSGKRSAVKVIAPIIAKKYLKHNKTYAIC